MEDNEVTLPSFEEVNDCAQGDEGIQIFAQFGTATANLKPTLLGVPWIMFNDVSAHKFILCMTIVII